MNFYLPCPYLLSDLDEILCKRSEYDAAEHIWFSWKSVNGWLYFFLWAKWIYIDVYTMLPYDILKVKNALVKPVLYMTEHTICSLVQ
jgi:hypothetical protein